MPRNETAELYVKYIFKFLKKIAKLFSKWLPFYISSFPVSLQTFITIFYVSYPKTCVVNLIVLITWISLKASNNEYLIMSFLLFSLLKYPFIFLVHFLTAFYCYESSLYILDESFVRYLLHKYFPVCSLSCHPNKILHRAKVFNFDDTQFTIFFLLWIILLMWSTDFYQTLHPKAISPMLSSKVLQVYILYLWSILSLFLQCWVLRCFFLFFCYHNLLKRWSFLEWIVFAPLSSINWPYLHVAISGFSILSCWSVSILSPWQHQFDYCT